MKRSVRHVLTIAALVAGIALFGQDAGKVLAATITVTNDGCRIRSDASTSADPVSSVDKGKKLDVVGEVTASDGYTWYKVKVEGDQTGYIRADLVSTPDGDVSSESTKSETKKETKSEDTSKKSETKTETKSETKTETKSETKSEPVPMAEVTETDAVTATVTADTVTVRSNASTKSDKKASAKSGQEVNISGEATDTEGKTWYQVSFDADGKTVEGFIRSDFLSVTSTKADLEPAEPEEPESVEEEPAAPEPVVNADYEVKYEANSEGIEEWFLYDHINGTKQSINNIHDVMEQSLNPTVDDRSEVKTLKIIIVVLAVLMLLLIAGVAVLLFKLRDSYEDFNDIGGYDDEDEVEEIEEEEEEEYEPRRRAPLRESKRTSRKSRARDYDDYEDEGYDGDDGYEEEEPEVYSRPARRSPGPVRQERAASSRRSDDSWSSRSLSDIDDDMEFEFLDLDN